MFPKKYSGAWFLVRSVRKEPNPYAILLKEAAAWADAWNSEAHARGVGNRFEYAVHKANEYRLLATFAQRRINKQ